MIYWLSDNPLAPFPPVSQALIEPNGLLAAGGDLEPQRLINAYRHGIFAWYSENQPILWWSPDPRCILSCDAFHMSRRLRRELKRSPVTLTTNTDFAAVINGCAQGRRGEGGTWIVSEMRDAYLRLHELGYAHSIEVWCGDDLVGGIYGVLLGSMFYAESMFTRGHSGSKIALLCLCRILAARGVHCIDCQLSSGHIMRLGATEIPRDDFLSLMWRQLQQPLLNGWPQELPAVADLRQPLATIDPGLDRSG
ncbi:MAG: leucyl/phenylalanyl-tRNA--protein transferase [Wenzhouxiangellaceae bacterium]